MTRDSVHRCVDALVAADLSVVDRNELAALVRRNRELRSWIDANDVRFARRASELADEGKAEPPELLLLDEGHRSTRDAADVTHRTGACEAMPTFEAALAAGEISAGHIDAIVGVMRPMDEAVRADFIGHEDHLLCCARRERLTMFQTTCRDLARALTAQHNSRAEIDELDRQRASSRIRRWTDKLTKMCHTHVELDPVRDAELKAALDAHMRRLRQELDNSGTPWNELEVEAFVRAVASGVTRAPSVARSASGTESAEGDADAGDGESAVATVVAIDRPADHLRVPKAIVLIDWQSLRSGLHEHGICETADGVPLPVDTVRRMCCDAEILPVVLDGHGRALDVGRSSRTVTPAQREALRAMHRTCIDPQCQVPFDACRIHHIEFYERDLGPTNLDNLVPLCDRAHHLVHEGGWVLTMTPDRMATWIRPDGAIHWTGTCIDRAPNGVGADGRRVG
jgi:hypothetical protein